MAETRQPCAPGDHAPIGFAGPFRGSMNDEYDTGPGLDEVEWRYTCMDCGVVLKPGDKQGKRDAE